jgi:hypothetical protein
VIKSARIRQAEHIDGKGRREISKKLWPESLKEKGQLENVGINGR